MSSTNFEGFCRDAVKDFLQTVIVIDDGVTLGSNPPDDSPKTATKQSGSLLNEDRVSEGKASEKQSLSSGEAPDSHLLDAKELTDAFFREGIVAGLFKPTNQSDRSEILKQSVAFAVKSDVVIIDWKLENIASGSSTATKKTTPETHLASEIIVNLISDDYLCGGRLRTIIVYTAETDLTQLRDTLLKTLRTSKILDFLTNKPVCFRPGDEFDIISPNLQISFFSKAHGKTAHRERRKSESELPNVVINTFASNSNGLLPAFALRSTAAIRQNTHHLLTRFPKDLDGAYLTHRALLPDPEDAEPFMLENFVSVVRNALSLQQVDRKSLGHEPISSWINQSEPERFKGSCLDNKVDFTKEELKNIFRYGSDRLTSLIMEKVGRSEKSFTPQETDKVFLEAGRIIASSDNELKRFSVLSSFKRSHEDVGWARPEHVPYLTQGTIIAEKGNLSKLFLCVTPKCDCIRIKYRNGVTERTFSFANLTASGSSDLVVNIKGKYRLYNTNKKFHELNQIKFVSNDTSFRVEANFDNALKDFVFTENENSKQYIWIGDLKDLNTHYRVGGLVDNLNRVGYDEFEWLRIKAKK